jgi:hypothetical protein
MEASHGKEEKRQESGKEKEKEESSTKEREKKVAEETRKKSGQEKVCAKKGKTQRKGGQESRNAGSNDGGFRSHSPFGSVDAGRGENGPEPGGCMALSDGLEAIKRVGSEPRSVRGRLCPGLSRGRSAAERRDGRSSCLVVSLSRPVLG